MKKTKLFLLTHLLLILLVYLIGCSSDKAEKVHQQIKIGMSAGEVLNILSKNEGRHKYWIKLCNKKDICEDKMYKPTEFIETINAIINRNVNYSGYEAKIIVLFIGPGFLKNDFEVHFNPEGKVKLTTPVRHWD